MMVNRTPMLLLQYSIYLKVTVLSGKWRSVWAINTTVPLWQREDKENTILILSAIISVQGITASMQSRQSGAKRTVCTVDASLNCIFPFLPSPRWWGSPLDSHAFTKLKKENVRVVRIIAIGHLHFHFVYNLHTTSLRRNHYLPNERITKIDHFKVCGRHVAEPTQTVTNITGLYKGNFIAPILVVGKFETNRIYRSTRPSSLQVREGAPWFHPRLSTNPASLEELLTRRL